MVKFFDIKMDVANSAGKEDDADDGRPVVPLLKMMMMCCCCWGDEDEDEDEDETLKTMVVLEGDDPSSPSRTWKTMVVHGRPRSSTVVRVVLFSGGSSNAPLKWLSCQGVPLVGAPTCS